MPLPNLLKNSQGSYQKAFTGISVAESSPSSPRGASPCASPSRGPSRSAGPSPSRGGPSPFSTSSAHSISRIYAACVGPWGRSKAGSRAESRLSQARERSKMQAKTAVRYAQQRVRQHELVTEILNQEDILTSGPELWSFDAGAADDPYRSVMETKERTRTLRKRTVELVRKAGEADAFVLSLCPTPAPPEPLADDSKNVEAQKSENDQAAPSADEGSRKSSKEVNQNESSQRSSARESVNDDQPNARSSGVKRVEPNKRESHGVTSQVSMDAFSSALKDGRIRKSQIQRIRMEMDKEEEAKAQSEAQVESKDQQHDPTLSAVNEDGDDSSKLKKEGFKKKFKDRVLQDASTDFDAFEEAIVDRELHQRGAVKPDDIEYATAMKTTEGLREAESHGDIHKPHKRFSAKRASTSVDGESESRPSRVFRFSQRQSLKTDDAPEADGKSSPVADDDAPTAVGKTQSMAMGKTQSMKKREPHSPKPDQGRERRGSLKHGATNPHAHEPHSPKPHGPAPHGPAHAGHSKKAHKTESHHSNEVYSETRKINGDMHLITIEEDKKAKMLHLAAYCVNTKKTIKRDCSFPEVEKVFEWAQLEESPPEKQYKWLGDQLHFAESEGKREIQIKDYVPKKEKANPLEEDGGVLLSFKDLYHQRHDAESSLHVLAAKGSAGLSDPQNWKERLKPLWQRLEVREAVLDALQTKFNKLDKDGDGTVDEHEFNDLMEWLGVERDAAGILKKKKLMVEFDRLRKDSKIDFEEFAVWILQKYPHLRSLSAREAQIFCNNAIVYSHK